MSTGQRLTLDTSSRTLFGQDHDIFRQSVRQFFDMELHPHVDRWEAAGIVDRAFWQKCGNAGLLCPGVPVQYGGLGLDFRFNIVVAEELNYAGVSVSISLQSDIIADYFVRYASEPLKQRWLPSMVSGDTVTAIAMTEPGAGSDLQGIKTVARRDGDDYIISGSKTFITNGQLADVVIVVAQTGPQAGAKGISLILVEADRDGFKRGRNLDKIGQHTSDTSELFFDEVRVPVSNCLGEENQGFAYLMAQLPQERLAIAISAQAGAQRAFDEGVQYSQLRTAFGQRIFDFQNTRFGLADAASKLQVGWAHLDWAIKRHLVGALSASEASAAKLWHSELQWEICDFALQLHGGAGYMNETPIARLWRDARVQRIYGGTSEIMKEVIARGIGVSAGSRN